MSEQKSGPFVCARCGEAAPSVEAPCPACGEAVALERRFALQRIVGQGAVGTTWRALDLETGAPVDDDGAFRHLLSPGDYRMTAAGPPTEGRFELKGNEVWSTVDGEPTADATGTAAGVENRSAPRHHRVDQPGLAVEVVAGLGHLPEPLDVPSRVTRVPLDHLEPAVRGHVRDATEAAGSTETSCVSGSQPSRQSLRIGQCYRRSRTRAGTSTCSWTSVYRSTSDRSEESSKTCGSAGPADHAAAS